MSQKVLSNTIFESNLTKYSQASVRFTPLNSYFGFVLWSMQVIPPKDVWAEFLKKFETFSVTSNAVNNNRFKVRFDVKSESGSEVKLRCPLGTVEEVRFYLFFVIYHYLARTISPC